MAEPSEDKAILMVRGVASVLEKHHRVQVLDEALEAAVRLSHRYIPARQLPDKAVSLLDTACARVAISQHAVPAAARGLPPHDRGARRSSSRSSAAKRRSASTPASAGKRAEEKLAGEPKQRRGELEAALAGGARAGRSHPGDPRAAAQGQRAGRRHRQHARAGGAGAAAAERRRRASRGRTSAQTLLAELTGCRRSSRTLQGESPLILPSVDEQAVASVVQDWTGVPVGRMVKNEIEAVLNLAETLNQRVIGQRHALEMIARRIQTSRAKLDNPNKPIGVFMLCGPSGVGKTETALTLAEALYGGEQNVITINMSEFQEAHTVSTLKGSPPGLRRLRRGRRADRGGAPAAVQRRAARRGREGALRRARAVLPGVRQGLDGGRRRPPHRLQEHDHPAHVERRHRADREHVQGSRS